MMYPMSLYPPPGLNLMATRSEPQTWMTALRTSRPKRDLFSTLPPHLSVRWLEVLSRNWWTRYPFAPWTMYVRMLLWWNEEIETNSPSTPSNPASLALMAACLNDATNFSGSGISVGYQKIFDHE